MTDSESRGNPKNRGPAGRDTGMENTLDVREQFLADARRHKGNDMTQALRDALTDLIARMRIRLVMRSIISNDEWIGVADELAALLARLTSDGDASAEFEVWQDDMCVAGTSGPRDRAHGEAMHYAKQYAEDGPVRVEEIVRRVVVELPAAPAQPSEGEPR